MMHMMIIRITTVVGEVNEVFTFGFQCHNYDMVLKNHEKICLRESNKYQ